MIAPRVLGAVEAKAGGATQLAPAGNYAPSTLTRLDTKAFLDDWSGQLAVPTRGGWAAPAQPAAPAPVTAVPQNPAFPAPQVVPQTVGTPSWPAQWQQQQAVQQTTVSVPVTLTTQFEQSRYSAPPLDPTDLGPMASPDVVAGRRAFDLRRCLLWAAGGAALALIFGGSRRREAG